jgi:hypothetical protein
LTMADKRIVHLYHRAPDGRTVKMHMHMPVAVHVVRAHPALYSVDGKFVGERPPPAPDHVMRAVAKTTGRTRPWHYP